MKRINVLLLTISLIGIFLLIFISIQSKPKEISGYTALETKEYVETTGKILSIKNVYEFNIINLDNDITVVCYNCPLFKVNQTIKVQGTVSEVNNKSQINAEKIEVID